MLGSYLRNYVWCDGQATCCTLMLMLETTTPLPSLQLHLGSTSTSTCCVYGVCSFVCLHVNRIVSICNLPGFLLNAITSHHTTSHRSTRTVFSSESSHGSVHYSRLIDAITHARPQIAQDWIAMTKYMYVMRCDVM